MLWFFEKKKKKKYIILLKKAQTDLVTNWNTTTYTLQNSSLPIQQKNFLRLRNSLTHNELRSFYSQLHKSRCQLKRAHPLVIPGNLRNFAPEIREVQKPCRSLTISRRSCPSPQNAEATQPLILRLRRRYHTALFFVCRSQCRRHRPCCSFLGRWFFVSGITKTWNLMMLNT